MTSVSRNWSPRNDKQVHRGVSTIDWGDDESIQSFIEQVWKERYRTKWPYERRWHIQTAWYAGLQNRWWTDRSRTIEDIQARPWEVRLVLNRILPTVQTHIAKVTRHKPIFDPKPEDARQESIAAARLEKKLLQHYWDELDLIVKLDQALTWVFCTGNVFFKGFWDPALGKPIQYELPAMEGGFGEMGESNSTTVHAGDLINEVVPPFDLMPDPGAEFLHDCDYVMQIKRRSMSYLKERYGNKAKDLRPQQPEGDYPRYRSGLNLIHRHMAGGTSTQMDDRVTTKELWVKPNVKAKSGKVVITAQNKVLQNKPWPEALLQYGTYPFIHLGQYFVPGKFWYTCDVEQMIHPQAEYNKGRSQVVMARNLMAKPAWLIDAASNVSEITDEPGQKITYSGPRPPEQAQLKPLPRYVFDTLGMALQDISDVTGQHEVTHSRTPTGGRSGKYVEQLKEGDDTRFGKFGQQLDHALSKLAELNLAILRENVTETRIMGIVGPDEEISDVTWSGNMLSQRSRPRVLVDTYARLPHSRDLMRLIMNDLLQNQILGPQDREMILQAFDLGHPAIITDQNQADRARAREENRVMAKGEQKIPEFCENHEVHRRTHDAYRKSSEFKDFPDKVRKWFEMHDRLHKKMAARIAVEPQILLQEASATIMAELTGSADAAGPAGGMPGEGSSAGPQRPQGPLPGSTMRPPPGGPPNAGAAAPPPQMPI